MGMKSERNKVALYCRLSRDDGDKTESDSIVVQRHMLEAYCAQHDELIIVDIYIEM